MYASEDFVLITAPKTGSTTARRRCQLLGPGTSNLGRVHVPASKWRAQWRAWEQCNGIPDPLKGLADRSPRVIGTIRQPGSWYGSVYRYILQVSGTDGERALDRWTGTSADYRAIRAGIAADNPAMMRAHYRLVLDSWVTMAAHDRRPERNELWYPAEGRTLYQAMMRHYYEGADGWVRLEHQAADLAGLLDVPTEQVERWRVENVGTFPSVGDHPMTTLPDRLFYLMALAAWPGMTP